MRLISEQPGMIDTETRRHGDTEREAIPPRPRVPASPRPLKVLVVSHNCVGESNRKRVEALAQLPGLEVSLLTPRWWFEEGRRIDLSVLSPQPKAPGFAWYVGRTVATSNGTRHFYVDKLFALLRRFQPDVIDLHEEPFSLVALETLLGRELLAPHAAFVFYSAVTYTSGGVCRTGWSRTPYSRAQTGRTRRTRTFPLSCAPRGCEGPS